MSSLPPTSAAPTEASAEYSVETLSPVRRMVAARVTEAMQTIPHFRLSADIEVDALLALRRVFLADHPDTPVSLNDLLIKATAAALIDRTELNIQWVDGAIHRYRAADISVVMDTPQGLRTPIVRAANRKSVMEIACEVREFKARAAKGALRTSEIFGGTFSISNLGMFGVDAFDAVINPPQCAMLAIARAKPSIAVSEDGASHVAQLMRVTLSLDHRALDGIMGAKFLAALREHVEQPASLADNS